MAEVLNCERNAHPFINGSKMNTFAGKPVALLGKVDKVEGGCMVLKTTDGKKQTLSNVIVYIEQEVRVVKFNQPSGEEAR